MSEEVEFHCHGCDTKVETEDCNCCAGNGVHDCGIECDDCLDGQVCAQCGSGFQLEEVDYDED